MWILQKETEREVFYTGRPTGLCKGKNIIKEYIKCIKYSQILSKYFTREDQPACAKVKQTPKKLKVPLKHIKNRKQTSCENVRRIMRFNNV